MNKSFAISFTGQSASALVVSIAGLASSIVVARTLGPFGQGLLSYAVAIGTILTPLSTLGVQNSLVVELANNKKVDTIFAAAVKLRLLGSFLYGICIFVIASFSSNYTFKIVCLFLVLTSLCQVTQVLDGLFLSQGKWKYIAKANLFKASVKILLTFLIALYNPSVIAFASILFFDSLARGCVLIKLSSLSKVVSSLRAKLDITCFKSLLKIGLPLTMSSFAGLIMLKSDQVILEWFRGSREVGVYSVSCLLIISLYQFPMIYSSTCLKDLGKNSFLDHKSQSMKWHRFFTSSYGISIALFAFSLLFSTLLVPLFGSDYSESIPAYLVLAPSIIFVSLSAAQGSWLKIYGYNHIIAKRSAFSLLTNLVLNFLMIPNFGMLGAALATTLSQLFNLFCFPWGDEKIRKSMISALLPWHVKGIGFRF